MYRKIASWLLRLGLYTLSALPFTWRSRLGQHLGQIAACLDTRDFEIARLQLQCFLQIKDASGIARNSFSSMVKTFLEGINLEHVLNSHAESIELSDPSCIIRFKENPVLLLSAHFGNWELLAAYGARRGLNVLAVARRAKSALLQSELERLRERNGYQVAWKDDKQTPRMLIKHFSEGGLVAALLDQDMAGRGTFSPFFGHPVKSNVSLIELAQRRAVHIATAFCIRRPDGTFFIEVESMPEGLSAEAVFQIYHERLENIIRRYPEQWVWVHKRWRSMPDGSQLGRKAYLTYLQTLLRERSAHPNGLQT